SYIYGTNGESNGLVPMLRMYNDASRYVDQGGGKRRGAFAIYLETWHADVFMQRVKNNELWSLIDPHDSRDENGKDLSDVWGTEFEERYLELEAKGNIVRTV